MMFIAIATLFLWANTDSHAEIKTYYLPVHGSVYSAHPTLSETVQPLGLGRAFSKDYSIEIRLLHCREEILVSKLHYPPIPERRVTPTHSEKTPPATPKRERSMTGLEDNPWTTTPKPRPLSPKPSPVLEPTTPEIPTQAISPIPTFIDELEKIRWTGASILARFNLIDLASNVHIDWSLKGDFLYPLSHELNIKTLLVLGINARWRISRALEITVSGETLLKQWGSTASVSSAFDQKNMQSFTIGFNLYY